MTYPDRIKKYKTPKCPGVNDASKVVKYAFISLPLGENDSHAKK